MAEIKMGKIPQHRNGKLNPKSKSYDSTLAKNRAKEKARRKASRKNRK